jgi:hypothetical protein
MANFTSKADGDWNADGQTTWNEAGHPDGADDTAAIATTHDITASVGIVCGAVTIAGTGTLNTGASAATITSITNNGTGALTIDAGGCTFAGVLNNASSGVLTVNGVCTGITTFTHGTCSLNANVATGAFGNTNPYYTLTIAEDVIISGLTTNVGTMSVYVVGAGVQIQANTAGVFTFSVSWGFRFSGTAAKTIKLSNAGAGTINVEGNLEAAYAEISDCWCTGILYAGAIGGAISRCFCQSIGDHDVYASRISFIRNLVVGYNRDGSANAASNGFALNITGYYSIQNLIINATTPISSLSKPFLLWVENFGYIDPSIVVAASTLAGAVVSAGTFYSYQGFWGVIQRSASNPSSGMTYHARMTPILARVAGPNPLTLAIEVPIITGDSIAVFGKAYRSADSSGCADCWIDPEAAWFAGTAAVQWVLTNATTYYDLPSCTAATAGGTGAKGQCRILFRMKEYTASQYLDISDVYVVVTHADATTTRYSFSMQNWANGSPVADISIPIPVSIGGRIIRR